MIALLDLRENLYLYNLNTKLFRKDSLSKLLDIPDKILNFLDVSKITQDNIVDVLPWNFSSLVYIKS